MEAEPYLGAFSGSARLPRSAGGESRQGVGGKPEPEVLKVGGSSLGCGQSLSLAERDTRSVHTYIWEGVSGDSSALGDPTGRGREACELCVL